MILDLLVNYKQKRLPRFTKLFSKVNLVQVDAKSPMEAQVSEIEKSLDQPSLQTMLIYPEKYCPLGTVLSRKYVNAAKISEGPLKLADITLSPIHLSNLPNETLRNRVLFLAPHCDEAYLSAVLLHQLIGDEVFVYSFTHFKGERSRIKRAYEILGLKKDQYFLDSLRMNRLFKEKQSIKEIIRQLLTGFKPTTVFSVFPKGANFDHTAVAQVAREVILNESKADLIYGYVIQSRKTNPIIFPIFSQQEYKTILQAFGKQGLGKLFAKYLPFLKQYMQTYSEPLLRMIGEKKLSDIYSLPLEAERIHNYRIPNFLT